MKMKKKNMIKAPFGKKWKVSASKFFHFSLFLLSTLMLTTTKSFAATDDVTSATLLMGNNYNETTLGKEEAQILRLKNFSAYRFGDVFFYMDITYPTQDTTTLYSEFSPRFSIPRIFWSRLEEGFLKDINIVGTLEAGNRSRTYLYGLGVDLRVPWFSHFILNAYLRDDQMIADDETYQFSFTWVMPFNFANTRLRFQGNVDWAGEEKDRNTTKKENVLFTPELVLDLGNFWGQPNTLWTGVEYRYWKNKNGLDGVNESVPQLLFQWVF